MFFGLLLGFVLALMRMSPLWPVRWLARFYISIFRGTPLIAQFIYDLLRPAAIWY
ncbi:ABC transporter membrane protein [Salmonella enterica subsp. enterica serovar Typhimurium]|nr:ABC transporter membrane protein [Salmonella enterica subsp. enterica serovar Typhimurium]